MPARVSIARAVSWSWAGLVQRLGARFGHAGVAQAELAHGLAHEARLLAVALHQGDLQARAGDRQRDAGQAGAGAEVGQAASATNGCIASESSRWRVPSPAGRGWR
jgi:hypothetical protein